MITLLDLFKKIDSQKDAELKHTLEVMFAKSAAQIPEDANYYYENQDKVVLQGSAIKSLEPLRYLTNVKILVLDENEISDISPLFDLSNLQHLNLIGNEISSVDGIEKLQSLQELYLGLNLIKDVTPISILTNLRILGLRGNIRVSDISSLTKLTNLVEVNLSGTSVSEEDKNTLFGALPGCKVIS
jgi:Leucine-rich repeat (LRR) protein